VLILDNGTTAMTGLQEHPGTGRTLSHEPTQRLSFEAVASAMGVQNVHVVERGDGALAKLLPDLLSRTETSLVVARQPCVLAAPKIRVYQKAAAEKRPACTEVGEDSIHA
jgi:indolepyruvate ferredoxin oxidoreductase alpha subunit